MGTAGAQPTVSVIVPALNEAATVGQVVQSALDNGVGEVIVVDNCSTDGTSGAAAAAGAKVITQSLAGYGEACLVGSEAASGSILVYLDGDGSFDASEIWRLVAPIAQDDADLVLGSRELGEITPGAMPFHQRFGNWLAASLLGALYPVRVTDLGPFRAIERDRLMALEMSEMSFGWPVEMMVKAARRGYRVIEVPVSYGPRLGGQSKVSGTIKGSFLAGYWIIATILRHSGRGNSHFRDNVGG